MKFLFLLLCISFISLSLIERTQNRVKRNKRYLVVAFTNNFAFAFVKINSKMKIKETSYTLITIIYEEIRNQAATWST